MKRKIYCYFEFCRSRTVASFLSWNARLKNYYYQLNVISISLMVVTLMAFFESIIIQYSKMSLFRRHAYTPGNLIIRLDSISYFFFYFDICNFICLDTSHHFWLNLYFLNILYFFKYSCTNIFHRRSLCTIYVQNILYN